MSYGLVVAAVVAGFGLTAFCASVFHIKNFWALLGLVAAFGFGVPVLISFLTIPDQPVPWAAIGLSLGVAGSFVAILLTARFYHRSAQRRRGETPASDGGR